MTSALTFATLGYSIRGTGTGWDFRASPGSLTLQPQFAFRFDPPTGLLLSIPGLGEAPLVPDEGSGSFYQGQRSWAGFGALGGYIALYRIFMSDVPLLHTMQAYFTSAPDLSRPDPYLNMEFAYGNPTPANVLAAGGNAVYALSTANNPLIQVDFAGRTVTGMVEVGFTATGPRAYQITDGVINPDRTRFTARLVASDGTPDLQVDGIFMGPAGTEIALRASFPTLPDNYPYLFFARRNQ